MKIMTGTDTRRPRCMAGFRRGRFETRPYTGLTATGGQLPPTRSPKPRHSLLIAHCSLLRVLLLVLVLAGCGTGRAPVATLGPAPTPTPVPTPVSSELPWLKRPPAPVRLPADEAPHDVLTEWWYYTGHLDAADGARYGFEFVIFQVGVGEVGPAYISHFAVTDIGGGRFHFDQRREVGPPAQPQPPDGGFSLALGDWRMRGRDGRDHLQASMPGYGIDLALTALKPAALHLGEGFISFGAAGDSYYYSRTRMAVAGTLTDGGTVRPVTGQAWFDHQWGDFISVRGGGWDWYSLQLDDNSEVMLFNVRDPHGTPVILYGSVVDAAGATSDLLPRDIDVTPTGSWTSPRTDATYPSGWQIRLPRQDLTLTVTPVVADQELDTRPTTGVVYWEGAVEVRGTRGGAPVSGRGYVELTGYAR